MTTQPTAQSSSQPSIPRIMSASIARQYGGPEVLSVGELPTPTPKSGQMLVKIEGASANALDWHFISGTPLFIRLIAGLRKPKRVVNGADIAGTVVALGADVSEFAVGDRVFGESGSGGGFGQYAAVKPKSFVLIPDEVSSVNAGATPVAGLTALQALRTHGKVEQGDHVLINGAAGGVGTFAVQIAKALGAEVTAVCSGRNVDMVRTAGADHVANYEEEDFIPGGRRFDVFIDNVGNRSVEDVESTLKPGARYVVVSGPKDNRWLGPVPQIMKNQRRFRKFDASFKNFTASPNFEDLTFLGELLASGQVKPVIGRTIGIEDVQEAIREIATGHTRAKIVVVP